MSKMKNWNWLKMVESRYVVGIGNCHSEWFSTLPSLTKCFALFGIFSKNFIQILNEPFWKPHQSISENLIFFAFLWEKISKFRYFRNFYFHYFQINLWILTWHHRWVKVAAIKLNMVIGSGYLCPFTFRLIFRISKVQTQIDFFIIARVRIIIIRYFCLAKSMTCDAFLESFNRIE